MFKDYRILAITAAAVISVIFLIPTFTGFEASWYPADKINLGLDLQGGMHVVLHVDVARAVREELERLGNSDVPEIFEREGLKFESARVEDVSDQDYRLLIQFAEAADRDAARDYMEGRWQAFDFANESVEGKSCLVLRMKEEEITAIKSLAMDQARETLNNRIDEFNVREPEIYAQGDDQIVVRLPGVVDPGQAKSLIGRTARLDFKLISDKAAAVVVGGPLVEDALNKGHFGPTQENLEQAKAELLAKYGGKEPDGYKLFPDRLLSPSELREAQEKGMPYMLYLLRIDSEVSGSKLTDARTSTDEMSKPVVTFAFDDEGAEIFADLTGKNIGKQLAVVLDDYVYSAPVIRSQIYRNGQIEGVSEQEGKVLSIALRAGALPVPVMIGEERTVGATLGEDSIAKGVLSFIVGGAMVLVFMLIYYRKSGIAAVVALVLNIAMILAGLAMFGATLPLPGIAGIVLTIGMAVDANVIINERIREELRIGKTPAAAVRTGYQRATWTILDAQITTLVAAAVLYQFGTGPIKGFAVTLTIGLIASLFTGIIVTRVIIEHLAHRSRETLSI